MHYRREIDGLRALAVLPVVLFHAGLDGFEGGYLGVDVFFVISGYLITTLILTEVTLGTFTLAAFYARRLRRIMPALVLVMLASLPLAGMTMLPHDLQNFGQSLVATNLLANNILHLMTSGYFALPNTLKPLMHTWSLGIEEQYYLAFPVLILLLSRLSSAWPAVILAGLGIASFASARHLCVAWPDAAFLLMPTRLWEFFAGALVARAPALTTQGPLPASVAECTGFAGLAMIAYGMSIGGGDRACSVAVPLIPVVGTVMVIYAAHSGTAAGKLLGHRWLVGLGLLSYSLYLWHQPLFAFARLQGLQPPGWPLYALMICMTLVLSYASWRFVEQPFRDNRRVTTRTVVVWATAASALLTGIGLILHATAGLESRWPDLNANLKAGGRRENAAYNFGPRRYQDAPFDAAARRKVLILGDSFARDIINAGLESGAFASASLSYSNHAPMCIVGDGDASERLRRLIAQADAIVFGAPTAIDIACWPEDATHYRRWGAKRLIVIGTKDFGWHYNRVMRLPVASRLSYMAPVSLNDLAANAALAHALPSTVFVDLIGLIADGNGHVPLFTTDGHLISHDRRHLTRAGAAFVGQRLFEHPLLQTLN